MSDRDDMDPFAPDLMERAAALLAQARGKGRRIVTVESCTGGLLAAALTGIAGSSDVVEGGFVTYSNAAKERLGVPSALLAAHGAVSREVALAMAHAARGNDEDVHAVAVTGIAGPGGGSPAKPVGLVHLAVASAGGEAHKELRLGPLGRGAVRLASVNEAIELLCQSLNT